MTAQVQAVEAAGSGETAGDRDGAGAAVRCCQRDK